MAEWADGGGRDVLMMGLWDFTSFALLTTPFLRNVTKGARYFRELPALLGRGGNII